MEDCDAGGYDFTTSSKIQTLFSVEQDLRQITPGLKAKGIFSFDRWNSSRRSRTSNTPTVHPATGRDAEGNLVYTSYDVAMNQWVVKPALNMVIPMFILSLT